MVAGAEGPVWTSVLLLAAALSGCSAALKPGFFIRQVGAKLFIPLPGKGGATGINDSRVRTMPVFRRRTMPGDEDSSHQQELTGRTEQVLVGEPFSHGCALFSGILIACTPPHTHTIPVGNMSLEVNTGVQERSYLLDRNAVACDAGSPTSRCSWNPGNSCLQARGSQV